MAGWTDYGDFTRRGMTLALGWFGIIAALNERLGVVNSSWSFDFPEIGAELVEPYIDTFPRHNFDDSMINQAIPAFVNHTVPFDPASPTLWTQSTIAAATTAGTWIPAGTMPGLSWEWLFQRYEIINLLLWRRRLSVRTYVEGYEFHGDDGGFDNYIDAVDNAETQALTGGLVKYPSGTNGYSVNMSVASYGTDGKYHAEAYMRKSGSDVNAINTTDHSINLDYNFYDYPVGGLRNTFDNAGIAALVENTWCLVGSGSATIPSGGGTYNIEYGNYTLPKYPDEPPGTYQSTTMGWRRYNELRVLEKYNVTGGFEFQ